MLNNLFKKLLGIDKLEENAKLAIEESLRVQQSAKESIDAAKEAERLSKLTPKELATEKKEPYVAVLDTHVNKDNIRNGFFELDWNEYFVVQLRLAGYIGDSEEEIVDKWFQDLCRNIGAEAGVDMDRRNSGYINVNTIGEGKSEIS